MNFGKIARLCILYKSNIKPVSINETHVVLPGCIIVQRIKMPETNKITVSAPAHLHTGNFDVVGDLGRLYGTVGFAIDMRLEIEVSKAEDEAAFLFASRFADALKLPEAEVVVKRDIQKFVGIGYHTTLALSIGSAMAKLY